jgi:hypothetical protein
MVVISAKKIRKKGKAAPVTIADTDPIINLILSAGVVYLNKEKKGAGGSGLGSFGFSTG